MRLHRGWLLTHPAATESRNHPEKLLSPAPAAGKIPQGATTLSLSPGCSPTAPLRPWQGAGDTLHQSSQGCADQSRSLLPASRDHGFSPKAAVREHAAAQRLPGSSPGGHNPKHGHSAAPALHQPMVTKGKGLPWHPEAGRVLGQKCAGNMTAVPQACVTSRRGGGRGMRKAHNKPLCRWAANNRD